MSHTTFTIRSFGTRQDCAGVTALKNTLAAEYQEQSVSVEYARPSGIKSVIFVDVTAGAITESYGKRQPVDFIALMEGACGARV